MKIGVYQGRLVQAIGTNVKDIRTFEMVRALQRINRFNGHGNIVWTVAQHSLLVQRILKDQGEQLEVQLAGLLHDASEAYINDVIRPLKVKLTEYSKFETQLENVIMHKYKLDNLENYPQYKAADNLALYTEVVALMGLDTEWERTFPDGFKDPKIFDYVKYVKTENSDIVAGRFLVRLSELLNDINITVQDVNLTVWNTLIRNNIQREKLSNPQKVWTGQVEFVPVISADNTVYIIRLDKTKNIARVVDASDNRMDKIDRNHLGINIDILNQISSLLDVINNQKMFKTMFNLYKT